LSNVSKETISAGDAQQWYLLRTGSRSAAANMAIDEVLLELADHFAHPILRFYGWSEPAASFGYSQRYSEIEKLTSLRPLVRRPTGGGLVPHDSDWTYSLVFPTTAPWYSLKATASYQRVHGWVQAAFERVNFSTRLADQTRKQVPGQCFVGAEQFDVLWQERKIAGGAQRRNRQGLLIQGSIQPPSGCVRAQWEEAFCELAANLWGVIWKPLALEPAVEERIQRRAREKFASQEFIRRR
jgi:lipoate-protein ligase A